MLIMGMPRLTRDDELKVATGQRLADTREALKMTQDQLAEILHITRSALANWEGGRGLPDAGRMVILRARFGVPLDWIYANAMAGLPNDLLAKILEIQAKRSA